MVTAMGKTRFSLLCMNATVDEGKTLTREGWSQRSMAFID